VSSAGLVDTLAALVGVHDLELDDAAFDKKFHVKAKDPARAKQVLRPDVRDALMSLRGHVKMTDASVSTKIDHNEESSELVVQTCREIARVAALVG
jgi:hypothetical protein